MTPAEQLKAKIVPAAAKLKAEIEAKLAAEAEAKRQRDSEYDRKARAEALTVLAEAKAAMARDLKMFYEPKRNIEERAAEFLVEIGKQEGFVVTKHGCEWGWCGVTIKIP